MDQPIAFIALGIQMNKVQIRQLHNSRRENSSTQIVQREVVIRGGLVEVADELRDVLWAPLTSLD